MKLQKLSLFGAVAGALLFTAAFVPQANAATNLLTYYNFQQNTNKQTPSYISSTSVPFTQSTTLTNDTFGGGEIFVRTVYPPPPPPSNTSPAGTTTNQWFPGTVNQPADPTTANPNNALDLAGTSNIQKNVKYCFEIGAINTVGSTNISLSLAIASFGNGGQFDHFSLGYSTTPSAPGSDTALAGSFTTIDTRAITQDAMYHTYTFDVSTLAGATNVEGQSTLYFQLCFTTTKGNNANGDDTFIDNIQVTGQGPAVPEPSTYIGGLLGIVALCWYQRRWLFRSLRLGLA